MLSQFLEFSPFAVVLGRRAGALTAWFAKQLYLPGILEEFDAPMTDALRNGFRLGAMLVSPLEGTIERPDGVRHVQPKVMDVLVCLARHPGEVVERDLIVEEVWYGRPATDDVLTRCISELRHHLGDSRNKPEFIKTVPKRGYQLVAPVAALADVSDGPHRSGLIAFMENLRRRRVFRAVGVYAISAWIILQVADVVIAPLGFPRWTMTVVVWIAVLGFPVAVALAWMLQVTGRGLVYDNEAADTAVVAEIIKLRPFDYAILMALLVVGSFAGYQLFANRYVPIAIQTESGAYELPRLDTSIRDPNSIAVLPFLNIGDDPRMSYLGMGLAEEVLNLLANIQELQVPSRQSSFQFRDRDMDIQTIAKELRVKNVLEGSIQGEGSDLRITAQLIDADSGYHIWSQTYRRDNSNMLGIRDEIAQAVVESLKLVLSVESQSRITTAPTQNIDAYDYYLQALSYLRRPKSELTLDNAEGLFRRALDLDPEYAKASAGLCEVYLAKYQISRQTQHVQPAEAACNSALAQDPGLPEVHSALGSLYRRTGQYEKAELEFQRAVVRNPRLEPAYYGLGRVYMAQDRLEEAEAILKYSVDLEPGYWGTHLGLGNFYLNFGQPEKAITPFVRVTELNPTYAMGFNNLGAAYYNSGDLVNGEQAFLTSIQIAPTELALSNVGTIYFNTGRFADAANKFGEAVTLTQHDHTLWGRLAAANSHIPGREQESQQNFRTAIELALNHLDVNPNDAKQLAYLAAYYANTGDEAEARDRIARALSLAPKDPHVYFFAAHVEVIFGNYDVAIRNLAQSAELGYSIESIANDPEFAPLLTDPRFRAIIN